MSAASKSARAPGKKTAVIILDGGRRAVAAYEELRSHMLRFAERSTFRHDRAFARRGCRLDRAAGRMSGISGANRDSAGARAVAVYGLHSEIVHVLANIALTYRQEARTVSIDTNRSHCRHLSAMSLPVRATVHHAAGF